MKYLPFPLHNMLQKVFMVIYSDHYWTKWPRGCTTPWEPHSSHVNPCSVRNQEWISTCASTLASVKWAVNLGLVSGQLGQLSFLTSLVVIHTWHQRPNLHGRARVLLWWAWEKTLCCARQMQDMGFIAVFYTNRPPHSQFQPKEAGLLILITFQCKAPAGALFIWLFIVEFGGYFPRTVYSFSLQL